AGWFGADTAQRRRHVRFRWHRGRGQADPDAACDYRSIEPGAGPGGGGRPHRRPAGAFVAVQGQLRAVGGARARGGADPGPGHRQRGQAGVQRSGFLAADRAAGRPAGQSRAQPPRRNSLQPGGLNIVGKLLALFKSRLFITLVGLLLLSLLIWFGGPNLGFGGSQPLTSPVVRLLVILVLVVIWAVWLQIRQMASDLSEQGAPAADGERNDRSANERAQLQGRFQEAVDTLRKNRRGGTNL